MNSEIYLTVHTISELNITFHIQLKNYTIFGSSEIEDLSKWNIINF